MKNLQKAADTLSTMLVQEIKGLNVRQRAARKEKSTDTGLMKDLKEATAVLKDLTGVTKTLNDQGMEEEGQNLSKYIKQYRMEKAKELLTGTNMKIVNISEQVGYPNVSYFVQSFREYFGVSPQKFRDQGELS